MRSIYNIDTEKDTEKDVAEREDEMKHQVAESVALYKTILTQLYNQCFVNYDDT